MKPKTLITMHKYCEGLNDFHLVHLNLQLWILGHLGVIEHNTDIFSIYTFIW